MLRSALQLKQVFFPKVFVEADAEMPDDEESKPLVVRVRIDVLFAADGDHFCTLLMTQSEEGYPYKLDIGAFAQFAWDGEQGEQEDRPVTPPGVALTVGRLMVASARELVASVTSRAPYGPAVIPTMLVTTSDINVGFEDGKERKVLTNIFHIPETEVDRVLAAYKSASGKKSKAKVKAKTARVTAASKDQTALPKSASKALTSEKTASKALRKT